MFYSLFAFLKYYFPEISNDVSEDVYASFAGYAKADSFHSCKGPARFIVKNGENVRGCAEEGSCHILVVI